MCKAERGTGGRAHFTFSPWTIFSRSLCGEKMGHEDESTRVSYKAHASVQMRNDGSLSTADAKRL